MAELTGFTPLDGIPDAAARGMGTFHFDDGNDVVHEDPELAQYAMSLTPPAQAAPLGADAFGAAPGGAPQVADFLQNARPDTGPPLALRQPYDPAATPAITGGHVAPDAGSHAATTTAAAGSGLPAPATGGLPTAPLPPPPSDAAQAAEIHRLAGEQALRGGYVAPRQAGYVPVQRQGALPEEMAQRQAQERGAANDELLRTTEEARRQEAEALRKSALDEAMRISVQKAAAEKERQDAETRRTRLLNERRAINDAKIDTSFGEGNGFAQAMGILGAALLGATGSNAGLQAIDASIDRTVRKQMQVRGNKLEALANELGSEEQAVAAAKAKIYGLLEKEAGATGKLMQAAGIEHNTPAILAQLKQKATENEQEHERLSLGKTVENYQAARAGGRTGPNLDAAAKHFEAASKLAPKQEQGKALEGLTSAEEKDFIARVEGLADAEDSLNEIDQNVGIQRDGAGNVSNRKQLGNIEGAGFIGGRVPDTFSSEKGAALSRHQRRLVQAQVKAMSGAAATDVEREEYGKNLPLGDEKDFVNSTTEERRRWHRNYAKAVSLYGQQRVDQFMRGYRGTRGGINAQRGQAPRDTPLTGTGAFEPDQED